MFLVNSKITEEKKRACGVQVRFFCVWCGLEGRNPEGIGETWVRLRTKVSRKAILPTK
jgi:hypothetical protein